MNTRQTPVVTVAVGLIGLLTLRVVGDEYYVWTNGTHTAPYTNWAMAAHDIQTAVGQAGSGDTIWVTNGTYVVSNEIEVLNGKIVRSVNGPDVTIAKGAYPASTNRIFKVRHSGTTLMGLTITNGYYVSSADDDGGAGVYMTDGTFITNCAIAGNDATSGTHGRGGGVFMYWAGSATRVAGCTIANNRAANGGGLFTWHSEASVEDCTIRDNDASTAGGGVLLWWQNTVLEDCTISGNTATNAGGYGGGGLIMWGGTLSDCLVVSNRAAGSGGIRIEEKGTASNCVIRANTSGSSCGVYLYDSDPASANTMLLRNCLVVGNEGQGVNIYSASAGAGGVAVENCTIVRNAYEWSGAGLYRANTGTVTNSIVYHNLKRSNGKIDDTYFDDASVAGYCCAADLAVANGNITNDPQFVDSGSGYGTNCVPGDYHLSSSASLCVNGGINMAWMSDATDLGGAARISPPNGTVDMGAYEYIPAGTMILIQ